MAKVKLTLAQLLLRKKKYEDLLKNPDMLGEDDLKNGIIDIANKSKDTMQDGTLKVDFIIAAKALLNSQESILVNYKAICRALNVANVNTKIKICGEEMSIAEAIVLNTSSVKRRERELIFRMKEAYATAKKQFFDFDQNINNHDKIENFVKATVPENSTGQQLDEAILRYHTMYDIELIDPLDLEKRIKEKQEAYDLWEEELNITLAQVNATTVVEVDLVG